MTLFSYKVFLTTVEQMNFRKAADILNLTPSAVSHCISNMEEELGFPLFIRKSPHRRRAGLHPVPARG